jgi:DNA-binding CsgD family transcriptional regulator/GAF domain-containing protein
MSLGTPTPTPLPRYERAQRVLGARRREQTAHALGRVSETLGWPPPPPGADWSEQSVRRALDRAWQETVARLTHAGSGHPETLAFVELLHDIRACEHAIQATHAVELSSARERVRDALRELRTLATTHELVRHAPAVAARIGFDRVMLSRIDDGRWVPESVFVSGDERWAREILETGRAHVRRLDTSLLESRIRRFDRALLVPKVEGTDRLHPELVAVTRTDSYAAAPITVGTDVVGLLHADHRRPGRAARAEDRDLLWLFSDGLSHLVSRVATLEATERLRARMHELLTAPAGDEHFGRPDAEPHAAPGPGATPEVLTPRESEVARMMSEGCTNSQIARRLVLSEGTVKTHVKHILAKLHASNRAEAVAIWLSGRGHPRPVSH